MYVISKIFFYNFCKIHPTYRNLRGKFKLKNKSNNILGKRFFEADTTYVTNILKEVGNLLLVILQDIDFTVTLLYYYNVTIINNSVVYHIYVAECT